MLLTTRLKSRPIVEDEFDRIDFQRVSDDEKLDQINATLSSLHFGHDRLRLIEQLREVNLTQSLSLPCIPQHFQEEVVFEGVK
jgi:hypothetical protein